MDEKDRRIEQLKKEIEEIEREKEIETLESYKKKLSKDLDAIVEGECPHCLRNLKFSDEDRKNKETICPVCNKEFRLIDAKRPLTFGDLKLIEKGDCPNCNSWIALPLTFDPYDEILCHKCKKYFRAEDVKNRKFRKNPREVQEGQYDSEDLDNEFASKLSSYKLTVLLTIFLDVLFIPTLVALSDRSKLNSMKQRVSPYLNSSFSSWDAVFVIGLILKVIFIGLTVCSALTSGGY